MPYVIKKLQYAMRILKTHSEWRNERVFNTGDKAVHSFFHPSVYILNTQGPTKHHEHRILEPITKHKWGFKNTMNEGIKWLFICFPLID